jgi:hypothetical protein
MAAIGDPAAPGQSAAATPDGPANGAEPAHPAEPAEASESADLTPNVSRFKGPTPASMLRAATSSLGAARTAAPGVSAETLNKVERAGGSLATRSVALMDQRLPWFRSLPAEQRSWVTLVAQAGISGYVIWARAPGTEYRKKKKSKKDR